MKYVLLVISSLIMLVSCVSQSALQHDEFPALNLNLIELTQTEQTCQQIGGVDCTVCCATPIKASNTESCCIPNTCIERITAQTTFEKLGQVRVERFPNGRFHIWHGTGNERFGSLNSIQAELIEDNEYKFTLDGIEHQFTVREGPCSIEVTEKKFQENCAADFSCDVYFIVVPVDGNWNSPNEFKEAARQRTGFFQDISTFKFKKVGFINVPLLFAESRCDVATVGENLLDHSNHQKIKNCADIYSSILGIGYERAIGFSNTFSPGRTFFSYKAVWTSRGYSGQDRPGMIAHELGHTYNLCDEYTLSDYTHQNNFFSGSTCKNKFPLDCSQKESNCRGNTPTFRDYEGPQLDGVCQGTQTHSVMGWSFATECGYDKTGGYQAVR
jgi:hypothetical protein